MKHEGYIYLHSEGCDYPQGPFTEQEIRRYWAYGIVRNEDWLWHEGDEEYTLVSDFFKVPTEHLAARPTPMAVITKREDWQMLDKSNKPSALDKPWILQVFAWFLVLAATVCLFSLPEAMAVSLVLFSASFAVLGWFLWMTRSAGGWVALGINVILIAMLFIFQPREQGKSPITGLSSMSIRYINQDKEQKISE